MMSVGIRELRQRASELLRQVERGESIEITDRGRPVAVISPLPPGSPYRRMLVEGEIARASRLTGELPEPLVNLISLQQARIKLGQAGARTVTFRGGRFAVTPIELDSARAKRVRAEIPEALYESGKSQLSLRVPDDPAQRFPAVVRAADVLLAVTREAA